MNQTARPRISIRGALFAALGLAVALASVHFVRASAPGGDGILARVDAANGSTYLVTQRWNDWMEPYTVALYFRGADGRWGWCYIDHESDRWRSTSLQLDESGDSLRVLEAGRLRAELRMATSEFALSGDDERLLRAVPAPQEWRDPPDFAAR